MPSYFSIYRKWEEILRVHHCVLYLYSSSVSPLFFHLSPERYLPSNHWAFHVLIVCFLPPLPPALVQSLGFSDLLSQITLVYQISAPTFLMFHIWFCPPIPFSSLALFLFLSILVEFWESASINMCSHPAFAYKSKTVMWSKYMLMLK